MKQYKSIAFLSVSILFFIFLATSCSEMPIFYEIEQEVSLKKASVVGNVYSIIEHGSSLYVTNGNIYKKDTIDTEGSWSQTAQPSGSRCIALAASGTTLYALTNNQGGGGNAVYASADEGTSWGAVSKISGSVEAIFGDGNKAFVSTADKVYPLNKGEAGTEIILANVFSGVTAGGNNYFAVKDVTDTPGGIYKDTVKVVGTPSGITCIASDGTHIYVGSGNLVYSYNGTAWKSVDIGKKVLSLTCQGTNQLVAGTVSGIKIVHLTLGEVESFSDMGSNTNSFLGGKLIHTIYANTANTVYAGVTSVDYPKNSGLAAYYTERNEWNRE